MGALSTHCQRASGWLSRSGGGAGRGKRRVLRKLETGQAFGELALQVAGGQRAATIKARDNAELLTINGFEYRDVLAVHHRRDIAQRVRSASPRAPAPAPSRPRPAQRALLHCSPLLQKKTKV